MRPKLRRTRLDLSEYLATLEAELQLGLCRNCDHVATCTHLKSSTAAIWYCEEYSIELKTQASPALHTKEPPEVESSTGLLGLCCNCDHSQTCTLPRPQSGVWHCEEYA